MQRIDLKKPQGRSVWQRWLRRQAVDPQLPRTDPVTLRAFGAPTSIREAVNRIFESIARDGDQAVVRWTRLLEGARLTPRGLWVSPAERRAAERRVAPELRRALLECAAHITDFHAAQKPRPGAMVRRPGVLLQERLQPLERVGLYVPAGQAPLVSTVLMNAIPAKLAGVRELVLATPPDADGRIADALLYAARVAGVHEIYRLGGAVAVSALAVGTPSIPRVDKIVGPGNMYVNEAKRRVAEIVGIDQIAGPSEILIIADAGASPETLAWDLLGQGEHGAGSVAVLIAWSDSVLDQVEAAGREIVREHSRLRRAWDSAALVKVKDRPAAVDTANDYAPEHLSLQVANAAAWLKSLKNFGAVFVGTASAQALGDYTAGPNHVLPTSGTARWSSPLSVRDFVRYASVIQYSQAGAARDALAAATVAVAEGLYAHAASIRRRARPEKG